MDEILSLLLHPLVGPFTIASFLVLLFAAGILHYDCLTLSQQNRELHTAFTALERSLREVREDVKVLKLTLALRKEESQVEMLLQHESWKHDPTTHACLLWAYKVAQESDPLAVPEVHKALTTSSYFSM
jgi:hypothetical protein